MPRVYFATDVLPRDPPIRALGANSTSSVVIRCPRSSRLRALPNVRLFPERAGHPDASEIGLRRRRASQVRLGARQKILEAWSMEKCVVSTTVGAEGLAYEDGSNLFIANSVETMASTVVKALRDPALRGRVRHGGRVVAESRHNPERLAAGYHAELTAVARQKAEADTPHAGPASTCGGCCRESPAE